MLASMTSADKVEFLLAEAAELPPDDQAELLHALAARHVAFFGLDDVDDEHDS